MREKLEEERRLDREILSKEKETIEVELAAEEKEDISKDTEGKNNPEILKKRESIPMVTTQSIKKVKVTMGNIYESQPPLESKQMGMPNDSTQIPRLGQIAESKITDPSSEVHQNSMAHPNGNQLPNMSTEMPNMHPMMHGMMYPMPGYGKVIIFYSVMAK